MIARTYRFHGHGSLNYLYRNGSTVRNRVLLLRYVQNLRRDTSRLSVVVSKKVAKSAVVRNRIRRRIYEIVRAKWPEIRPQVDFSITAMTAEVGLMPAAELENFVDDALRRARLYRSDF